MRRLHILWLILAGSLGAFISSYVWGPTLVLSPELQYKVLKDTLTIVLTVIAVAVTAFGFLAYRIVSLTLEREREAFERETGQRITRESRRWVARLAISIGYSLWKLGFPKEAERLTAEAHEEHARGLDERDPDDQVLIAAIRNNLASYFAEAKENRDLARGYATYIHNKSSEFPKQREIWEKTYKEVFEVFPDQE